MNAKQISLFQEDNIMSLEDFKKLKEKPKKKDYKEAKFGKKIEDLFKQLGLVWIHLKNKCLNRFFSTCPECGHKYLVTCNKTINAEYTGFPDYMILIAGLEIKARRYGIKTPKLRKGVQEDVCNFLSEKIEIKCINEESQEDLMEFLKNTVMKVKGEKL